MNPALVMLSVEDGLRQYEIGEALGVALFVWAIVSDNTGMPLSELVFKSIKLVDEK